MEEKKNDTLPALDDADLRKFNSEKVYRMVDEIADNMIESKKAAKATRYYLIGMILIFGFLILSGIVIVAIKSGSVTGFFENYFITDNIDKRIVCDNGLATMAFRTATEADAFKKVFANSTCFIRNKK